MIDRRTKLRWRRVMRRRQRQVAEIGATTEQNLERHLIRRLIRLPKVQRFLLGWVGLLVVIAVGTVLQTRALGTKYQTVQPKAGGTYTEGMIGTFTNANPLYASSSIDSSVSRLVFAGLLKYDQNNQLVGDLAESWAVGPNERVYTVKLKQNLYWHDGYALTAEDVVFTYKTIQNPESKSYLYPSWQNIKIEAKDSQTIVFTLPNSLTSFAHSLTTGIVPEHSLKNVQPSQLRSNSFNNQTPIGSGPFSFSKVEVVGSTPDKRQERVALNAYERYHGGKPHIDNFVFRTYPDEQTLVKAYTDKEVTAMMGPTTVPESIKENNDTHEIAIPLTGEVLVFFKTTNEVLADAAVRKALVLGANKKEIFDSLSYPLASVDEPLLKTQTGYNPAFRQATNNPEEAKKILDAAGWVVDKETGIRSKNGLKLQFRLISQSTSEYSTVTKVLQQQWLKLGVKMDAELQSDQDLQSTLSLHNYDALLYGISLGPDPDVFAYWHSTQGDPRSSTRLNFSEYKSTVVDQALEAGRTRSDQQLRTAKYKPFLEAWQKDAPALSLYQPRLLYIVHKPFYGFDSKSANISTDRFASVEKWRIRDGLSK